MRALKKETQKRNYKKKQRNGYQKLKEEDFLY